MADPLLAEAPPPQHTNPSNDFDSLSIPPLDPLYLASQNNNPSSSSDDLDFVLDENCDFDFNFDDFDNLYFPSENESFFLPSENPTEGQFGSFASDVDRVSCLPRDQEVKVSCTASPESGSSGVSGNRALLDVDSYLNYSSSQNSGNQSSNSNSNDCDREFSGGPASSQGSENCGSGVSSETTNAPSPDFDNLVVDQKIKVEEVSKTNIPKRKKENEDMNNESRSSKYLRSSLVNENVNDNVSEEELKKKARLMRNRESAQLSRQRKKHYVEELEDKVRAMHSTIADLNGKISFFMAENATLRQQLSGGSAMPPPAPHMGMYAAPHMAPMPYPWMPCAPYMVKPQGSQVPLVPIPRLKPQQAAAPTKPKKSDSSKNKNDGSKTKKVASVSFLGLLFFVLLFGGLVPFIDIKYGVTDGVSGGYFGSSFYDQHRGRVLTVNGYSNGSHENKGIGFSNGRVDIGNRNKIRCERGIETKEKESQPSPCLDEFVRMGNASEPLVASLYVPRNDKLVKIDGNLIIHSVLASEKAMASQDTSQANNNKETGLAIPKDLSPAFAIPDIRGNGARHSQLYRNPAERQRAITSGSADAVKDHMKSTAADGKLQQWFREGLAGSYSFFLWHLCWTVHIFLHRAFQHC